MSPDKIESLADVQPGDICLTTMGGFIPGVFPVRIGTALCKESFRIGPFSADHALICVETGEHLGRARAVQAMPRGAEEIALTPSKHWTEAPVRDARRPGHAPVPHAEAVRSGLPVRAGASSARDGGSSVPRGKTGPLWLWRPCPRCGAVPGRRCERSQRGQALSLGPRKVPHVERVRKPRP